jgi:hypothetical protein
MSERIDRIDDNPFEDYRRRRARSNARTFTRRQATKPIANCPPFVHLSIVLREYMLRLIERYEENNHEGRAA